jgi:hypothetical protein
MYSSPQRALTSPIHIIFLEMNVIFLKRLKQGSQFAARGSYAACQIYFPESENNIQKKKDKGKAIPLTGREGP